MKITWTQCEAIEINPATKAHHFVQKCAVEPLVSINSANKHIFDDKARFFIPFDDENDIIIMFSDNSGVYIEERENFVPVYLGEDISSELSRLSEIPQL